MQCPVNSLFAVYNFVKTFPAGHKILPDNAPLIPSGQLSAPLERENAFFSSEGHPFQKSQVRFQNGQKIDPLAPQERFPRRNRVQQETERDLPQALPRREVLGQHNEVIAEVQEDLSLIAFGHRPATDVEYDRPGAGINLMARQLQPPAEVDLFLVREKISVKAT